MRLGHWKLVGGGVATGPLSEPVDDMGGIWVGLVHPSTH